MGVLVCFDIASLLTVIVVLGAGGGSGGNGGDANGSLSFLVLRVARSVATGALKVFAVP